MLIEVRLENHKSFKQENLFSMEATDVVSKERNVVNVDGSLRLLKVGMIYGANASGKSNFMSLLFLLKSFITAQGRWSQNDSIGLLYQPFLLSPDGSSKRAVVAVKFLTDDTVYEYEINYTHTFVIEEIVYRYDGDMKTWICKRVKNGIVTAGITLNPAIEKNRNIPNNISVTKSSSILTPFLSIEGGDLSVVARYFASIQYDDMFYFPSHYIDDRVDMLASWIGNDKGKKAKILEYLKMARAGIEDFEIKKSSVTQKSDIFFVRKVYDDNHKVVGTKRFPYELESDGTIKLLFYAIRAIPSLESGAPLFVDEIGDSLHTQLTKELIEMFISPDTNPKGAQLIATTHDINLMDEASLRRDQIWFVQKDEEGVSEMYSLADFKNTDENTSFAQWYLDNRFGATPNSPEVKFTHHEKE